MSFTTFLKQIKTVPRCVDCKNYSLQDTKYFLTQNTNYIYSEAKCLKYIVPCSTTGLHKQEYAYIARSEHTMCGPKGTNFIKKEKKEN